MITRATLLLLVLASIIGMTPTHADEVKKAHVVRAMPATEPAALKPANPAFTVWRRALQGSVPQRRRRTKVIVFMSEGYTATEGTRFRDDAEAMAAAVYTTPEGQSIISRWSVTFYYIFKPSPEAVALDRKANTRFRTHLADDSLEFDGNGSTLVDASITRALPGLAADVTAVLCRLAGADQNPPAVRAWARRPQHNGNVGFMCLPAGATDAVVHELGHALFGLADEYDDDHAGAPTAAVFDASYDRAPNVSNDPATTRWRHVLGAKVLEGAATYKKGVYRPFAHCRMNEGTSMNFCLYCQSYIEGVRGAEDWTQADSQLNAHRTYVLLDPASLAAGVTGQGALLFSHRPADLIQGVIRVKPNTTFTLHWAMPGVMPKGWTVEFSGIDQQFDFKPATTTTEFKGGLPALPPSSDPKRKSYYAVWHSVAEHPGIRIPAGLILVE